MKKTLFPAVFIALIASLVVYANAHPGKTDGNGGHTDHSTGEYHYHHGYSEHDHYDIDGDGYIDCPYDFEDKTGQDSGVNGGGSNTNKNSTSAMNSKKTSPDTFSKICLSIFALFPVAFLISMPTIYLVNYVLSLFEIAISDKGFYVLMYTVYFLISGFLIYLIIIF